MATQQNAVRVTLSSKKVVLLREMKIKHPELAAQAAAPRANGDPTVLSILMQKELIKILIIQVDGKVPTQEQLEDLDGLFSIGEYGQIMKVAKKLMDDGAVGEPVIALESYGSK